MLTIKILFTINSLNSPVSVNAQTWFSSVLRRNFYLRTCVKFRFANKKEAMYERLRLKGKFEPRSTSCLSETLYSLFLLQTSEYTHVKMTRQLKSTLREQGRPLSVYLIFHHWNLLQGTRHYFLP